jgi:hypothetical protein
LKKSLKFLIVIGLILLAIYFFKYQFAILPFSGCSFKYSAYLDCRDYPTYPNANCGKPMSVKCGYTFLGDAGASGTTDCDVGYRTLSSDWQSVTTLKYGQTYSFFSNSGYEYYIIGYNCPTVTTTTTYPTTTTTTQPITTTTTYPTTTTIPYYPTTTTTTYPTTTTTTIPPLPEDETYLILGSLVALAVGLPVAYLLIRKKR